MTVIWTANVCDEKVFSSIVSFAIKKLPSGSTLMLLKLKGELGFKRMQTPFECVVPCE